MALWILITTAFAISAIAHPPDRCELGDRGKVKALDHMVIANLAPDGNDAIALRNHVDRLDGRAAVSAYALGFMGADENSIVVLRRAIESREATPHVVLLALEALCRLGRSDILTSGPRRMRAFAESRESTAQWAVIGIAGLLAANGRYEGWTYVRNHLSKSEVESSAFHMSLEILPNFRDMMDENGQPSAAYRELQALLSATTEAKRRELVLGRLAPKGTR